MKRSQTKSLLMGLAAPTILVSTWIAGCQSADYPNRAESDYDRGIYATPDDPNFRDEGRTDRPRDRTNGGVNPGINPATRPGGVREPDSGSGPGSPGYGNPPGNDRIGEPLR